MQLIASTFVLQNRDHVVTIQVSNISPTPSFNQDTDLPGSLSELATKLATNSPAKYEPANRRVRALLDGKWLFDTLKAVYVWEHPYCESIATKSEEPLRVY